MIVSNSFVNFLNGLDKLQLNILVDQVSAALVLLLSNSTASLADLFKLSLSGSGEQALMSSLSCTKAFVQQLVPAVAALILKCGSFGPTESLASCGLMRPPSEVVLRAYNNHQTLLDPLLHSLLNSAPLMELCGVSHELSVVSGISTRSRLCEPHAFLQLSTCIPPHLQHLQRAASNPETTEGSEDTATEEAKNEVILDLYKDDLVNLHNSLEEIQRKLDSFQYQG
ncbi:uncharacterized protein LOC108675686 [Hyalella azteca]|uniref:Uncharacterized protein LOC108675686 n=1 Tax=Hyalella azteca TaxID=294128 RepID=A0A8B7NZE7_HYAAZ|nr:uncharacterized protein LOC108675686 [Hyalella azteca]